MLVFTRHRRLFCQSDSTTASVVGNDGVGSLWDNAKLLPASRRMSSLELSSMVNESELLINVVMDDKPKMLTGLHQKVSSQVGKLNSFPT